MTQDEIIQMAKKAGLEQDGDNFFSPSHDEIDVHITDLTRLVELAFAHEREECAKRCESAGPGAGPIYCAAAIRARGNKK
jgi:hypothetical protein